MAHCAGFLCRQQGAVISVSDGPGAREQTAVDGVHNRSSCDHPSIKITAVQALDGVLSALDLVELEVDVARRIGVKSDVDDVAVLLLGLLSNLFFELLGPVLALLSAAASVKLFN
jgi:hypothetical protein